jgi:hypothetical protein
MLGLALQFPRTETREIKLLKALSHRNMVRLHEVVTAKGESWRRPTSVSSL